MRKLRRTAVIWGTILLSFAAARLSAAPPRVIKTIPENGDQDVDPALRQIRIEFDQDMSRGGFSICGSGPKFPKTIGKARWVNKRTIVMRVRLQENHEYHLSANCPSAKNFRSVGGEAAVIYPVKFRTGRRRGGAARGKNANEEAVEELRRAIDEYYSYREIRRVDWDKLFSEKGGSLRRAKSPEEFATKAGELLAAAEDKHIWLTVGEERFSSYVRPVKPNANFTKLKDFIPNFQKRSSVVFTGRFKDGTGYMFIDSWGNNYAKELEEAYAAISDFSEAPGVIIDVRGNGGGSETLAQQFAGCFIDEPKVYAQHVYRAAEEESGFSEPSFRIVKPNKTRPKYRGKVAVLTGPVVMSSCEAFLLMMKQVPGCKLVGATSQGSSGNPKPHELGNDVTVYLPSWKAMRPDGSCFEGEGIEPDIAVETTDEELLRRDTVVEAALEFLREG
jgi:hypothetical protein